MCLCLLELGLVVSIAAFASASIARAKFWYETLFFSFTLLVILLAFLLAVGRRGEQPGR